MKTLFKHTLLILLLSSVTVAAEVTIDRFMQAVADNNPDLELAERDLDLAELTKKEALSRVYPTIGAAGSYSRNLKRNYLFVEMPSVDSLGNVTNIPMSFPINKNNEYNFRVALSQTLFSFNVQYGIRASQQYQQLTGQIYAASRQGVFTWARKAFYSTLLLEEVLQITRAAEVNARENFEDVQNRFEQGLNSEFELLQAEVRLHSLLPEITLAERNLELAYSNLSQMAGWSLGEELQLSGSLEELPELPSMPQLGVILERRPDYNALIWESRMRQTGVKSARAASYPTLTGSFVYNYSSQSDDWVFDENRNNSWIAGVSLNIPIFTGGYISASVQRAQVELNKNQLAIERREHEIRTEIENSWLRLEEAHKRISSAVTTRELAEKTFRIAEDGVDSGLVSQLELKDARLYYDNAQVGYYAAAWEYLDAWFDWKLALGEGDIDQ